MFKPLLRTLPSLTGNIKLACEINDYIDEGNNVYSTYIRSASLQPLQNNLYNRRININLINGMWEYDVAKFYKYYSNYFYKQNFTFLYDDFAKLDLVSYNSNSDSRNKDYEFGCKHISYNNTGYMFDFFAPIYINSIDDIPDYLEIRLDFENGEYRKIKVHINTESNLNYLKIYIEKYLHKINRNVAYFISNTGRMIYYGIDVNNGGLVDIEDSHMSKYLNENTTVNNFDSELCAGFMNNKLIIRQILPLSFHFNIDDIISTYDKLYFVGHKVKITAYYYKNSSPCKFYDFDINYSNKPIVDYSYNAQYQRFVTEYRLANGSSDNYNILDNDSVFSLHEKYVKSYYYTNAITPMYGAWKMMFSSDSCPYITNINYVYTNGSTNLYGQFPKLFTKYDVDKYATLRGTGLILYSDEISKGDSDEIKEKKRLFRNIQNMYISNWYTLLNKYEINDDEGNNDDIINLLNNTNNWFKVENNYAYYKGILYNFNNCEHSNDIDYFGVFVKPTYSEVSNTSNLYSVTVLNDYEETEDGKYHTGDICINDQLHNNSENISIDYDKRDYLNDVYDFDNNYMYEDGKIVNKVNGAQVKTINENIILSKYTKANLFNDTDIIDKKLYITIDSVNTKHNKYIKIMDLFSINFVDAITKDIYKNDTTKATILQTIIKNFIFDNGLGLSFTNTFKYNLLRFSTLMLQKTFMYNSIYINNADTFSGFLLNYANDINFSRDLKINLNTTDVGTNHKWNIFADENGQVYEANVYISKNMFISIVKFIISRIQKIIADDKNNNTLFDAILSIVNKTITVNNISKIKNVLNEIFTNDKNNETIFENKLINILDNTIDNFEFIFYEVNLRNNLSITEFYNAINSIWVSKSIKEPFDSIINSQWPFTSIELLLAHINGNNEENPQINGGLNNALPNIHFAKNGYVEKIEKMSLSNPFNVDGDNSVSNYNNTLFIDAAYINKYEKHNIEFYTKYYDYIKEVYGDPYYFNESLVGTNILRMASSNKPLENLIANYSNNIGGIDDFDSLYNVGNYSDNLYKIKGPQYFFNNTINHQIDFTNETILNSIDNAIYYNLKYSFVKFANVYRNSVINAQYKHYDKYFPTVLTQELVDIAPKFDQNFWQHKPNYNIGEPQTIYNCFTTVLTRIVCKYNLDRLKLEIDLGSPITFKEDVLLTNENLINNDSEIYNLLKEQNKYAFDIDQQFSNNTDSYFYKYNMNERNIYNILTTHSMSEKYELEDIETMNPTYLSYPLLYDNVMKLFTQKNNDDHTSVYLFVGSPFLILPGIAPFENTNRGIFVNYSNNDKRVKFGTIPFISKNGNISFTGYNDIQNIFNLLNSETDAAKIDQYYDTTPKQINVLFDNLCQKIVDTTLVSNYDKYNPTKYNSDSNALFMFTDLGLSNSFAQVGLKDDYDKYILEHPYAYVYPNVFICSEFATLQDISTFYKNNADYQDDIYKNDMGMVLVSSLKNSYLHNVRNFAEILRFYKDNDTIVDIQDIYDYTTNTINNLIDQAYCYDKMWKTLLDNLYKSLITKFGDTVVSYTTISNSPEINYLNYIFRELTYIVTSYSKITENLNKTNKKYFDQYPDTFKKYIDNGWISEIKVNEKYNWRSEIESIIYDIILPLAKSMNIYRKLLETVKLYKVDYRDLDNDAYDNNDMLHFSKVYDGEYYSKLVSTDIEEKLAEINTLAIQYNNEYSFKAVTTNKCGVGKDNFNYYENVHNIVETIANQCENNLEDEKQISTNYTEFYGELYAKKELLPLDDHLINNMTNDSYQYYIYELCNSQDKHCSVIKYSKNDLDDELKHNLFEDVTNDMIKISNTDSIYYAKLFEYTENSIYKNTPDKNMLISLLNDNHIFSNECNSETIYGKIVYQNNTTYNAYHYKKDNLLFATQLNSTNYSILSSLIKDNLISLFKYIDSSNGNPVYNMLKILSDIIFVILNKFNDNDIHNEFFKSESEYSFANILNNVIYDIYDLINDSLSIDKSRIDFTKDIFTKIYGESSSIQINNDCNKLQNELSNWYGNYWQTKNTPIIDVSFENLILDINKNNRSLTNISKDLENFRQQICDANNNINILKIFKHITTNVCKNFPYKDIIIQTVNYIYNIFNGEDQDTQIIEFCDSIIMNIDNSDAEIQSNNRHVLAQLLNYFIIYHNLTLYSFVMNNSVEFGKLYDKTNNTNEINDIVDNIDNNLHIIERTNSDGTVTKYAYYCLNLNITNSSLHYNVDGVPHNLVMTFNSINNKYIESNKMMFIDKYFNLLYPLLKIDMLQNMLQQSKIVQKPYQFQQRVIINARKNNVDDFQKCYYKYNNGEHYIKELNRSYNLYKANNTRNTQVITLNRYLNYIEPILKETNTINDFKSRMFKTNNTIYSSQNLFTENINIRKYNPIIVFDKLDKYNTISLVDNESQKYYIYPNVKVKQYEYKHFNDNNLYVLENSFEYETNKLYTYEELLEAEENTTVYNLFKNYIRKRHNNLIIDENEILFLFNKYSVAFKSNFCKLDMTLSNKLYTLKYIFSLK